MFSIWAKLVGLVGRSSDKSEWWFWKCITRGFWDRSHDRKLYSCDSLSIDLHHEPRVRERNSRKHRIQVVSTFLITNHLVARKCTSKRSGNYLLVIHCFVYLKMITHVDHEQFEPVFKKTASPL